MRKGDKVSIKTLGMSHSLSLYRENSAEWPISASEWIYLVTQVEENCFYIDGHYYVFEDVNNLYTPEDYPEYFL